VFLRVLGFGGAVSLSRKVKVRYFPKCMLVAYLGAAGLFLGGCERACKGEALEDEEGRIYPCVGSTDCSRSGNGILCTSTRDRLGDCIDCIDNVCTLFNKDSCG
jgi:hypothetical protein